MKINVLTAFLLNLPDGTQKFEQGVQDVSDEVAGHWYTQAHSEPVGKAKVEKSEKDDVAAKQAAADAAEAQAAAALKNPGK